MYGAPSAAYRISGVVTDENGNPVEGIKASLNYVNVKDGEEKVGYEFKSATTDAEGRFTLETGRVEPGLDNKGLQIEDVDGEEHGGTFKKKFVRLNQSEAKQAEPGDGSWYMGKFAVKQDVNLEKE